MNDRAGTIGIDLGGTKILAAFVDRDGRIRDRSERATPTDDGPDAVIDQMLDLTQSLLREAGAGGAGAVGVGAAGQISRRGGVVRFSPNLGWHDVPLGERLTDALDRPVVVSSDVRAATVGEWRHGAGRGCDDLVCVLVGTGVGGSIVSGGHLLTGDRNSAGEIGHGPVALHGPVCHCGSHGCLEALAGGWAIAERARAAASTRSAEGGRLVTLADGDASAITARTVAEACAEGDPLATSVMDEAVEALIAGLTMAVNLLGPRRIVLGGGVVEGMPGMVRRVEAGIHRRALPVAVEEIEVMMAALGDEAVALGAATMARDAVEGAREDA